MDFVTMFLFGIMMYFLGVFMESRLKVFSRQRNLQSYNNCGNCTHSFFERLFNYSNHETKLTQQNKDLGLQK